jgi:hypothetical protein
MTSYHQCISTLLAILTLGSACKTKDPHFCEGAPYNNCKFGAGDPIPCVPECSGEKPICDSGRGECVQCTHSVPTCGGITPICRDYTCQPCTTQGECDLRACLPDGSCANCTKHGECDSGACLPDGSCGSETNIAYVDPSGTDNTMCTRAMPCRLVSKALATNRSHVRFTGTTDEAVIVDNGRTVTFLAEPGAKLTSTIGMGAIVTVKGNGTSLAVYDLSISDSSLIGVSVPASSGNPIVTLNRVRVMNNQGSGISTNGGVLTLSQSEIYNNASGGVIVQNFGQFDITNNFIAYNGRPTIPVGGVYFYQTNDGIRRFEFNTVTSNSVNTGSVGGVACFSVIQQVTFSNDIIYNNLQGGGGGGQVNGPSSNCLFAYSDIGPDPGAGVGNINADPLFINPQQRNFHLIAGSPVRDAADPNSTLAVDFDGEGRPQGTRRDIGADEVP